MPTVLTIHDVSYERHPEWYPYRRDWLRRAFYRRSARAAAHILTDSEFSRSEIAAAYGISADRITVAPLGASEAFGHAEASAPMPVPAGIVVPFLLHVGDLHERRNLSVVVQGLVDARRRLETPPLSLVLAGVDRGVGDRLAALAADSGRPRRHHSTRRGARVDVACALSRRCGTGVSLTLRRVRVAAGRSHGERDAGSRLARRVDSRGRR